MTTEVMERAEGFWSSAKVRILGLAATAGTLVVSSVSAVDLNASVGPKSFAL